MIRLSEGTSALLGLKGTGMDTYPTTAYLLSGENCLMSCSFCPRGTGSENSRLGRVRWPEYSEAELEKGFKRLPQGKLDRICLQAVRGGSGIEQHRLMVKYLKRLSRLPISLSAWINNCEEVDQLLQAGVDRISIAIDAASPAVYAKVKGGSFAERLELLMSCAYKWPGRITTHLICGLGESEKDLLSLIDDLLGAKIGVALFSFTPLKGTLMADRRQPQLDSYRRVQAGFYLLRNHMATFSSFCFRKGQLISFGLDQLKLKEFLADGKAYETTGCPGCNRPYYNERPKGPLYNYHRPLKEAEAEQENELLFRSIEHMDRNNKY